MLNAHILSANLEDLETSQLEGHKFEYFDLKSHLVESSPNLSRSTGDFPITPLFIERESPWLSCNANQNTDWGEKAQNFFGIKSAPSQT